MSTFINIDNTFNGNPIFGDNNIINQSLHNDVSDRVNSCTVAPISQEIMSKTNSSPNNPLVFISYSWDDEAHKRWVKKLAEDLISRGVNVKYDQNIQYGTPLPMFMQNSIFKADRVLIIGTPRYLQKSREAGTGCQFEDAIITESIYVKYSVTKFIPVLRSGTFETSFPPLLAHRKGLDFTNDCQYEGKLEELFQDFFLKGKEDG